MKRIMFFITIILKFNSTLLSQEIILGTVDPCSGDKVVLYDDLSVFSNYKEYLEKYFTSSEKKLVNYVKPKNEIKPFMIIDNYNSFRTKNLEIKINLSDTILTYNDELDFYYENLLLKMLGTNSSYGYYFLDSNFVRIKKIENIKILIDNKEIEIKKTYFNDLINPNLITMYSSFNPIKCFSDRKKNEVLIYITGEIDSFDENGFTYLQGSYICKIIYNLKTKETKRLIMPGYVMYAFGWISCPTFWPF